MKIRSAGSSSRSAAAFASTYARLLGVGEVLQQLRAQTLVAVEHEDRQQPARELGVDDGRAVPRSNCSGARSWQTTTTSCPALLHSRASARE